MMKRHGKLPVLACLALTCLALTFLSACGSTPVADLEGLPKTHYGAFVGMGPVIETQLAEEAALQLTRVYVPTKTLLEFQQNIALEDGFGQQLMRVAQHDGYFVRYKNEPATSPQCDQKPGRIKGFHTVSVCYIVDDVAGLLRLTLLAGGESWSRLFAEQENTLRPAGAWTQKTGK